MTEYKLARIYRIYIPGLEEYSYIGSTTLSLPMRMALHRHHAHSPNQAKSRSMNLFLYDNEPVIECLETLENISRKKLNAKEKEWIAKYPDCVNHYGNKNKETCINGCCYAQENV
jgi:hypothetical protein